MDKEVTIEAVESDDRNCDGCVFGRNRPCLDNEIIEILSLPQCTDGYIYKIKEK